HHARAGEIPGRADADRLHGPKWMGDTIEHRASVFGAEFDKSEIVRGLRLLTNTMNGDRGDEFAKNRTERAGGVEIRFSAAADALAGGRVIAAGRMVERLRHEPIERNKPVGIARGFCPQGGVERIVWRLVDG